MKTKNTLFLSMMMFFALSSQTFAYDLSYTHPAVKYTSQGLEIYSMPAKDFVAKWFQWQLDFIKNFKNGVEVKYVLGQTGDVLGTDNNDYFYGFDNYRTNNIVGWKWDDFYSIQHTYPIVENVGEWIDTYFTSGNTWPGKANVENIISAWWGGRVYGGNEDNLIITEWKWYEIWAGWGNDVILANGLVNNFSGWEGIDTVIFPGKLNDYIINGDQRWVNVKNPTTGASFRLAAHDIEQFQFDDAFFGYEAGENILSVWPNKAFRKVMDAVHVAGNGDTIEVASWVYEDDFAILDRSITIRGVWGKAHFYAKSPSFKGKANFITMSANITFDNVEFSGNKVWDKNGAGIRMEGSIPGWVITVKNSYFHNNEVGILAGNQTNGILNIENTEFGFNGHASSITHTVNVWMIKELNVKNSFFHDSINGHNIRSLADKIDVQNSFFADGTANTSFNIEVAKASNSNISGNTFVQSETAENTHMILNTATTSSIINGNTFINYASRGVSAINSQSTLAIELNNNKMYNYKDFVGWTSPKFNGSGNTVLDTVNITLPAYNTSVGNIQYNNPTPDTGIIKDEVEFTQAATLANFSGKDIFVWVGKDYSNLKDAVLNAKSWDKIYVDEWVYTSDYATISNKNLAIIWLGKWAEFKKVASIPNGKAIFVSFKSNLLVKNIIFSDSDVPDKNGAWIRYEWGTLTIVESTFKNNENGILGWATDIGKGKIWIQNSKFLNNGKNGTGYTHAIYIGEIDYFEIKDSTVSGTAVGHHVKSRARKNVIENNILDDAGKDSSYNIDLPNGGEWLIKGNTIIQSIASPNRTMVSYSAEKNPPNAGKLIVENNTFTSEGTTAIWVKNFKDNQVILRNNTFNNVSTPYTGNNITVENTATTSSTTNTVSSTPSSVTQSTPIIETKPATIIILPTTPLDTTKTDIIVPQTTQKLTQEVSAKEMILSQTRGDTTQTPKFVPKVVLMTANNNVLKMEKKIDVFVQTTVKRMDSKKRDAIYTKVDTKLKQLELKNMNSWLSVKENKTYFLLKMLRDSLISTK